MTCETALERMLEADPAELRPTADSDLARHIERCDRCRRTAAVLVQELDALDAGLQDFATAPDPAAVIAEVLGALAHRRRRPLARPRVWMPLAAAAALAAILLVARDGGPPTAPAEAAGPPVRTRVAVTPPPDRGAAILETRNPKITVVWIYEREGS